MAKFPFYSVSMEDEGFLLNIKLFSVYCADTCGQTLEPSDQCRAAFAVVSIFEPVKKGNIRNTTSRVNSELMLAE